MSQGSTVSSFNALEQIQRYAKSNRNSIAILGVKQLRLVLQTAASFITYGEGIARVFAGPSLTREYNVG